MLFFRSVSVLFLISAALGAADPFVGTLKLNVEKSDFGDSPTAKSGSTTYEATGTGYMYVAANVFGEDQVLTRPALFRYFFTDSEKLFTIVVTYPKDQPLSLLEKRPYSRSGAASRKATRAADPGTTVKKTISTAN
jgi:hypothetical protein